MRELLGGKLLSVLRCDQLHKLPNGSVSNERSGDELHQLPDRDLSRCHRRDGADELWRLHGGELLRHDRPHGCYCCLCSWAVLCGISCNVLKLSDGSISILYWLDELQQLSYGHICHFNWLCVV